MKANDVKKKEHSRQKLGRVSEEDSTATPSSRRKKALQGDVRRSYIVPVLSKAITIINLIESSEKPLNVQQIHEALGHSKATIYRILHTLIAHGVLSGQERMSYSFRRIAEAQRVIKFTHGSIGQYKK